MKIEIEIEIEFEIKFEIEIENKNGNEKNECLSSKDKFKGKVNTVRSSKLVPFFSLF